MGRWQYEEVAGDRYIYDLSETPYVLGIPQGACKWAIQGEQDAAAMMACSAHNADCDAYESRITALESRLARIAELVKPVPVADLVEAGTEAPALLAERHRQIRAILEDEGNE